MGKNRAATNRRQKRYREKLRMRDRVPVNFVADGHIVRTAQLQADRLKRSRSKHFETLFADAVMGASQADGKRGAETVFRAGAVPKTSDIRAPEKFIKQHPSPKPPSAPPSKSPFTRF